MLLITRTIHGRTASGGFDKNKYTAAHKKLPLAQELKSLMKPTEVYNCRNYRSWTFVKSREIDLQKKLYGYRKQKGAGSMLVTIDFSEIILP
jgi:hypothetical protein